MISTWIIALMATAAATSAAEFKLEPMCSLPPPPHSDALKCCRIPEVLDDKIMEKCAIKVFGGVPPMPPGSGAPGATPGAPGAPAAAMSPPSQSPQPELPLPNAEMLFSPAIRCLAECIFNETGVLKDRVLQVDLAISQAKAQLQSEQEWIPAFETSIKACKDFVSKISFDEPKVCGHSAAYLIGCFNTQLFKNCPASRWKDETGCAQLRSSTEKCPVLPALMQSQS